MRNLSLSLSLSLSHTHTHTHKHMLHIVPSPPLNVSVSPINSTSLRVAWQPPTTPNGQPTYNVYYKPTEGSAPSILTLPNDANETIISNLIAYTTYTVAVSANTSCSENRSESVIGRTDEAIPDPPTSVTGVALPTTITVKWEEPAEPRGIVTHYNVSRSAR